MYKIAVLGDRDSVLGFRALGLDVFFADDAETARKTLHRLAQESYAVIYVTEQLAQSMAAEIARYQNDMLPAVILIPGKGGDFQQRCRHDQKITCTSISIPTPIRK